MKVLLTGMSTYDHSMVKKYHDQYESGEISKQDYALYILNCLELYILSLVTKFCFNKQDYEDKMSECRIQVLAHLDEYDPEKASLFAFFKPKMLSVLYRYDGILSKINASYINKTKKALSSRCITNYDDPAIWEQLDEIAAETGLKKTMVERVVMALNFTSCELLDNCDYENIRAVANTSDEADNQIEQYQAEVEPELRNLYQSYVVDGETSAQIMKKLHLSKKEYKRQMSRLGKSLQQIQKIRDRLELPELQKTEEPEPVIVPVAI